MQQVRLNSFEQALQAPGVQIVPEGPRKRQSMAGYQWSRLFQWFFLRNQVYFVTILRLGSGPLRAKNVAYREMRNSHTILFAAAAARAVYLELL
jgi:hypothetical protein